MIRDDEKIIDGLVVRLSAFPLAEYLSSEQFSRLCREHDMEDEWNGFREFSRDDMPDLYGKGVVLNAFVRFLRHIFHSRPEDFPELFSRVLPGLSGMTPESLPVDELERDLVSLGYPVRDIDAQFSAVKAGEEDKKRNACECGPGM